MQEVKGYQKFHEEFFRKLHEEYGVDLSESNTVVNFENSSSADFIKKF